MTTIQTAAAPASDRLPDNPTERDTILRFYRVFAAARTPQRADRSAAGTLPTRAFRFCDAVTRAAAFGWYVFSPIDFDLLWDGADIFWSYAGCEGWLKLDTAQLPGLPTKFDDVAPEAVKGCSPPFLTALAEPGVVQVWTGLFARTAAEWSLHVRAPANLPLPGGFAMYEGIVETDRWFGPLFTNVRLTRTDVPIRFRADFPLLQVQPVPRAILRDELQNSVPQPIDVTAFTASDWSDYQRSVVAPNDNPGRVQGNYAATARRHRKSACPFAKAG